jgi:arylsulfatase A-like enzyme
VALAALAALAAALIAAPAPVRRPPELPMNIVVLVTDDQPADTWTTPPPGMPWLQSRLGAADGGWTWFTEAVVSTPMCCPSRATILTGLGAWQTGVLDNATGFRMDEDRTVAVYLQAAGYRTAMIGKYLNGYPWDRGPYVPPGWDRWLAKTNDALGTTYTGFGVVDQGMAERVAPSVYATDLLGRAAISFVETTPADQPWFLYLAPSAPHAPATPAPGDAGTLSASPSAPVSATWAPAWTAGLPPVDLASAGRRRLAQREALLAIDRALAGLWEAIAARGELDETVIIVTSDNGFAFGDRGWVGKQVPWESSIGVPLAVYVPGRAGGVVDTVVSNLDIAPTIAALAGIGLPGPIAGADLLGPLDPSRAVPLMWSGGPIVPAWQGIRTGDAVYIRWSTGEEEAYDLATDPDQSDRLAPNAPLTRELRARFDADPALSPG